MHKQLLHRIKLYVLFVLAFFCGANIYTPSLEKVQLGRPRPLPNTTTVAQFLSQKKEKNILLRIACTTTSHCTIFNFNFLPKNWSKIVTICIIIITFFLIFQ